MEGVEYFHLVLVMSVKGAVGTFLELLDHLLRTDHLAVGVAGQDGGELALSLQVVHTA